MKKAPPYIPLSPDVHAAIKERAAVPGLCPVCALATIEAMQENLAIMSGSNAAAPPLTQGIVNGRKP